MSIIKIIKGDIFLSEREVLVNPVNCKGVMGAGLAEQFKRRYPEMFFEYHSLCLANELTIGTVHFYYLGLTNPKYITNFPTKDHWRNSSEYRYIELGLINLKQKINELRIKSLALPALGCGLGGLRWEKVRPIIKDILEPLSSNIEIDIVIPERNYDYYLK